MANDNIAVWGVHAGEGGQANSLFLNKGCVALGWAKLGDLLAIGGSREAYKAKVAVTYADAKPGAIPVYAGQLYRFVHEMKIDDYVVYPSKVDQQVHIGQVTGEYKHDPALDAHYPNIRAVNWMKSFPRTQFTQGALYEIGSAMTFFQVKNYAEEFLGALHGQMAVAAPNNDVTVALVAEEIEQTTCDFILKKLAQEMKGHPLAQFCAHLLGAMGYRTRVSPPGPDGGVDIIAHKDELGFEPPIIKVQVKSTQGSVGQPEVSGLYGTVEPREYGLLITLGTFTSQAKVFAQGKSNLRLIDGKELISLILDHYEQFDSKYKGIIPLKRVYVPEALEATEE
jgi:restriction system protein